MMVLAQACRLSPELAVRFAALCHDFGKGLTPPEFWPSHHGHGQKGLPLIRDFCERFRVPNECRDLALLVSDLHTHIHIAFELKPATLLKVFDKADAWRRPERFAQLLDACRADFHGRTGFEERVYAEPDYVAQALAAAQAVPVKEIVAAGFKGRLFASSWPSGGSTQSAGCATSGPSSRIDEVWRRGMVNKARVNDPGFFIAAPALRAAIHLGRSVPARGRRSRPDS